MHRQLSDIPTGLDLVEMQSIPRQDLGLRKSATTLLMTQIPVWTIINSTKNALKYAQSAQREWLNTKKYKRKCVTVCDTVNQEKGQLFKALLMKTNSSERRAKGYHS